MSTVRIWSLESEYDVEKIKRVVNERVTDLQLGNLSIQASSKNALRRYKIKGASLGDTLRRATQSYLEQDARVIFVTDQERPMSIYQRWQKPNSLINQIEQIVTDSRFAGKVFLARAVHDLGAWLPIARKSLEMDPTTWQKEWESKVVHLHNSKAIRINGTRVGIEIVIEKYRDGASPVEIQEHHPHLTLKQIYATITDYLLNKETISAYIEDGRKRVEAAYEEQRKNPSSGVKRLMKIKAQREASRLQVREETQ
jgi:uncharacterized protein (DUF433 family)